MNDGAPASRLLLVRHGRVHNPDELAYGHLPRFRIDPEGRRQAERAARRLAAEGVVALYASPLLRARQTALIVRRELGDVPLHQDRRLRESELARLWQGLPWQEIAVTHPELYAAFESTPSQITTGETMAAMASRMASVCQSAARRYPGAAVALISHRDPILALRLTIAGGNLDALNQTACLPGSITELLWHGNRLDFARYVEP
ncbi:MAG: histidine phosphatase family protein [Dehalococcoidia bacterium]